VAPLKNEKQCFKDLLEKHGKKFERFDEIWKWYNFIEKKGIASF